MDEKDLHFKHVSILYPPEEWKKIRKQDIRQKGMKYKLETMMIRKGGEPFHAEVSLAVLKGAGGKMASSVGNVITLKNTLDVYLPEIIRYLFAGTKPKTEFAISFDEDVFKVYEDFYDCEKIYFDNLFFGFKLC